MANYNRTPIEVRFWTQVSPEPNSGCWLWTGATIKYGYGTISKGGSSRVGRKVLAHRLSYEMHKGAIPDGLVLDHLCRNPSCVNPDHLEAVTQRTNTIRGLASQALKQHYAAITHCVNGHAYTPENTYTYHANGYEHRGCRICRKEADRRRKERNRQNVVRQ